MCIALDIGRERLGDLITTLDKCACMTRLTGCQDKRSVVITRTRSSGDEGTSSASGKIESVMASSSGAVGTEPRSNASSYD